MNCEELARTKVEILCWGIKPTVDTTKAYFEQNPLFGHKTGNVGLNLILDNRTVVLANTQEEFCKKSPYELKKKDTWKLYKYGKELFNVQIIKAPHWYKLKTSSGTPMPDIFLHEGKHYLHESYKGCGYFAVGEECNCAAGKEIRYFNPKDIAEVVNAALKEDSKYQICLSGGTILTPDKGANHFVDEITAIRKVSKIVPIFVELAPPDNNQYIQKLIDAGANSLSMNIEIWDDKIRKQICPGKSKIPKQSYLDVHKYAAEKMGKSKNSCVFVGGFEPIESLLEGAEEFLKLGSVVEVMPFKPWKGSKLENKPPASPDYITEATREIAHLMKKYNLTKEKSFGCPNCGACAVEQDFLNCL